ncbi:restriction endonuclease [Burkholderia plantarii]|uniref:restriction endonuclease n=1 Tax=Burkholderia plantarii TaxID=41899 RepID=UPI00114C9DD7|nr:restriction endonuclease [Burkholderia plantarii]
MRPEDSAQEFELVVTELLINLGLERVERNVLSRNGRMQIDITFREGCELTVVEVKKYRYASPPPSDVFLRALHQISLVQHEAKAKASMLVMSCPLIPRFQDVVEKFANPNLSIWDANVLLEKASSFPNLRKRLENLLEVPMSNTSGFLAGTEPLGEEGTEPNPPKGEILAEALRAVVPGKAEASIFEDRCIEALKYVFDADLVGWHEQHDTEDGLHRRDLVCRIRANSEVWALMLNDLKSRYVIFEFKNYTSKITQKEIVTTERYLYPAALRTVAIIISPQGSAPSALKVIQGAMREHGKLILSLTVNDLCSLLTGKDRGSDPNTFLFEQVDDFLMSLGR